MLNKDFQGLMSNSRHQITFSLQKSTGVHFHAFPFCWQHLTLQKTKLLLAQLHRSFGIFSLSFPGVPYMTKAFAITLLFQAYKKLLNNNWLSGG